MRVPPSHATRRIVQAAELPAPGGQEGPFVPLSDAAIAKQLGKDPGPTPGKATIPPATDQQNKPVQSGGGGNIGGNGQENQGKKGSGGTTQEKPDAQDKKDPENKPKAQDNKPGSKQSVDTKQQQQVISGV